MFLTVRMRPGEKEKKPTCVKALCQKVVPVLRILDWWDGDAQTYVSTSFPFFTIQVGDKH